MRSLLPLLVALSLVACTFKSPPAVTPASSPHAAPVQETLKERKDNCTAIYDHLLDMAVTSYILEQKATPSPEEKLILRSMIASTLRSRGVMSQFALHCLGGITQEQVLCEMKATSYEAMDKCEPDDPSPTNKSL